ncbi:hypothetical protein Ctob_007707, partial [Chrysochromulina tobinii]
MYSGRPVSASPRSPRMVPQPPTTARPQSARPIRSFTPRPPFDHEQWVTRCVTRREEDWRRRNVLLAMQAYGCATANAKKLHELSFKDYVAGVGAFKAGGDPFRTFKGLKPLSTRESAFEKQRLLALRKRMALLEPPKPKPARAKPNYAREVFNEVTDEELIQAQTLLRQLVKEKWKTFRQAFFALDEDRSGKIDMDEFMRIVMHGNLEDVIRPQTLRVLMGQIDINNDGTLGMERQLTEAVDLVTGALMLASEDGMTMQRHVQRPARRLTPKVANIASIVHAGSADAWTPLFARLDAREPIVLGVFGASVAQNGGCLDQPYKRCMRYDGVHSTFMRWGEPHIRPFKGFAVRLLEYLNATYPHPKHQINNSALDATPAQNALPCLFSHLPTTLHVVILEFGSMAFHLQLRAVEGAARMLLSLRPRPLLIFLSMHEWCQRHKDQPRTLYEPGERLRGGFVYPDTPWARAEAETHRVCERYGQACLSMHRALEPKVRQKLPGFSLSDVVGEDCLHPTHGVHGVEYIAEVLQHAFVHARGFSISSISAIKSLPAPLHIENADIGERTARCYGFVKAADYRKTFGQSSMYRSLQPIEWTSVWCPHSGEYEHSPPPLANKAAAPRVERRRAGGI